MTSSNGKPFQPAIRPPATIALSENSRQVLKRRYLRRGLDGQPIETIEGMFRRVARAVAEPDAAYGYDVNSTEDAFYGLLTSLRFFPNSPTFTGAGTPLGQLAACFVLPISDDLGKQSDGIFQTLRDAALIQQTGGGNGFSFSRLRPKGDKVASSAGVATGPVGFLRVYDTAFGEVAQGGCLVPDTLIFTAKGLLRLDEIVDPQQPGWQAHSLEVATDEGWRTSPQGYNNGVAPVLRVHTRHGLSLAGTPEHRVKILTESGPEWRCLRDLKENDWIMVRLGQHRGELQALRHPQRGHGNQTWPKLPGILDEELAFFLGYLTGDGFVASRTDDHRVGVSIPHTSYLVEEMPALLERLFGTTAHRQQKPADRSITLVLDNRAIKEFLQINGLDKPRSHEAYVPRLIRQSPPAVVGAYLRGLFEADGALSHGYPCLTTTSPRLAEEVATLLIGLGCPVRLRTVMPGVTHFGKAHIYHVRIESSVGLQAWRDKIGCDKRSRFVAAYAWESDQRRESTYVLPAAPYWLEPVLAEITLPQIDRRARGLGRKFRSENPHLRRALLRYLRNDRNFTRSAYDELCRISPEFAANSPSPDGWWFVQVTGVEAIGEALTLDLEVNDNHTYLAYGMVTHNTRRGANMAVLRVDHPDIEEFISCKAQEGQITNFNISVGITDAFMRAVEEDADFPLVNPRDGTVWRTVRARELFDKMVTFAHHNGEPGALFLDAANRSNPVPHLYELEATNPCFVGSTRIATDRGLITIQELAETNAGLTVATDLRAPWGGRGLPNRDLGVVYRSASPAWKTRENTPVLKLTTQNGYSIVATPDHQFLTPDRGYVELSQLRVGDKVLLQSGAGIWSEDLSLPNLTYIQEKMATMAQGGDHASGQTVTRRDFAERYANLPTTWSHELGVVLGVLVGDGWLSPDSHSPLGMVFAEGDDELLEIVQQFMQTHFGQGHLHQRPSVRQLTYGRLPYLFFESLGVLAVPAHEKRVPASIWKAPRPAVVGFLQGLFTTDGTVNVSVGRKSCSIRLASASVELLREVQLLLLNFGIVSRLHRRREAGYRHLPDGKGGRRTYLVHSDYELILDKANRDCFLSEIGFLNTAKQRTAQEFVARKSRRSNRESFETKVASIEEAGTADVYDLTETQTHSVIANGIVVHQCGEQWLGPYENCCLGSINLAQHITADNRVDWEKLRETTIAATRFLDNVVDANKYVPAVPQLREAALRARRIGLGIMGLGDIMYALGVRYGSEEGQEFAAQIMEFIRYHCMLTSIELARERGPFPAIKGSIYDPDDLKWRPPAPLAPYRRDWGRPAVDWEQVVAGIRQHGIRNAAQTTVAPTGTIGTVAGCEGYGCEPVFALAYTRTVKDGDKDLKLTYTSPLFEKALLEAGLDEATRQRISEQVSVTGSCQDVLEVPEAIRRVFVVAQDITAEEHVRMQAAIQAFVDNSISKTINFMSTATVEDVAAAYRLAWKLGCKGLTVYVTGSRQEVVLETKATAQTKTTATQAAEAHEAESARATTTKEQSAIVQPAIPEAPPPPYAAKRPRPSALPGYTYRKETPLGTAFITVNVNGDNKPFEVFMNVGKAGSDVQAVSEALGRLISLVLRLPSPLDPVERLKQVIDQLAGIGGGRALGFGASRVRSLPDAVAQVLREHLNSHYPAEEQLRQEEPQLHTEQLPLPIIDRPIGDLCPDCGQAAFVPTEGCRKCYVCGYSEC